MAAPVPQKVLNWLHSVLISVGYSTYCMKPSRLILALGLSQRQPYLLRRCADPLIPPQLLPSNRRLQYGTLELESRCSRKGAYED